MDKTDEREGHVEKVAFVLSLEKELPGWGKGQQEWHVQRPEAAGSKGGRTAGRRTLWPLREQGREERLALRAEVRVSHFIPRSLRQLCGKGPLGEQEQQQRCQRGCGVVSQWDVMAARASLDAGRGRWTRVRCGESHQDGVEWCIGHSE